MNKKIIGIFVCMLLFITAVTVTGSLNNSVNDEKNVILESTFVYKLYAVTFHDLEAS